MNLSKKSKIYLCVALALPVLLYMNRDLFISPANGNQVEPAVIKQSALPEETFAKSSVTEPLTPEKAVIAQAVTDFAVKVIQHSPNQLEAFYAAAEAQSLRIQKIRTQRHALAAEEKKSQYEKQLYVAKAENVDSEVEQLLKTDSDNQPQQRYSQYTMSHQGALREPEKQSEPKDPLAEYSLKSIRPLDSGFRAVVSNGTSDFSVTAGFELPGGVTVKSITAKSAILASGAKTQTLYVF